MKRTLLKRKARRRSPDEIAEAIRWAAIVGQKPLIYSALDMPVYVEGRAESWPAHARERAERHHAIPRQTCRRHKAPQWDARNGLLLTETRHRRHHNRSEPLERADLPDEVWEFAAEHGLTWYLEKHYRTG